MSTQWAIVSNGSGDPMATPAQTSTLVGQLSRIAALVAERV